LDIYFNTPQEKEVIEIFSYLRDKYILYSEVRQYKNRN